MFAVIHKAGEALPDGLASVVAKLDNLAAGKPPSPAELEPFRSAASAKLQEDIQRANLTLEGGGIPNSTLLARDELISGLPAGTNKITPESVVDIRKLPDGRTVWLETGATLLGCNISTSDTKSISPTREYPMMKFRQL